MKVQNLKLIAKTDEDLRVLSAHLQDSIVKTSDIVNLKKNIHNASIFILIGIILFVYQYDYP